MNADTGQDSGPLPHRPTGCPPLGVIRCEPAGPELLREVLAALEEL